VRVVGVTIAASSILMASLLLAAAGLLLVQLVDSECATLHLAEP